MSYDPSQPPPYQPPPSESLLLPAKPPGGNRLWLIVAGAIAVLLVVIGSTVAIMSAVQSGSKTAAPKAQSAGDEEQAQRQLDATPTQASAPATTGPTLAASDMTLTLKITEKQCFGSAGCSLTVKVNADHRDDAPALDPDDTWLVTYAISGVEDGPVIGSFEITGDTYTVNEESLSTKSSKSKVTVKVTSVEKVGI